MAPKKKTVLKINPGLLEGPLPSLPPPSPPLLPPTPSTAATAKGYHDGYSITSKMSWPFLVMLAVISFTVLVTVGYLYINVETENVNSLERQMKKLKTSLVTGIKDIKLNYRNSIQTAEEILNLPTHLEKAAKALRGIKKKYQSIFRKNVMSTGGWQLWERSLYYFSKGQKTWYDAENFCMSRDAHLASILHDKEQNYITSQLTQAAWIGLTDENKEGGWEWSDRSTFTAGYWSSKSPSHTSRFGGREQDCVSVVPSLGTHNWKAANCHELYRWVCKENLEFGKP